MRPSCRHYVVTGRVQGVFFRASTQQAAQRLRLTGWVCNLADGRVELLACGDPDKLAELETWLWQGPPGARVEQVSASDADDPSELTDFRIRY